MSSLISASLFPLCFFSCLLVFLLPFFSLPVTAVTVHLVPHTHDDVGWDKTVDQYYISEVQYILTTVIEQLQMNPDRKFIYVEQAFFQRWWRQQNEQVKQQVRNLVMNKQLEFINGGWCMHDEAAPYYVDMIDQTTRGHRFILEQFGVVPTVTWQIDPFGHSATQAALLTGIAGFQAVFFGRIDYQDNTIRANQSTLEWIWQPSPSLGPDSWSFAGKLWNGYGPPSLFNWGGNAIPVQDDPTLTDYNLDERVNDFVTVALTQAAHYPGENIMWTMGSDFQYQAAHEWFTNLDKIIKGVNANTTTGVKAMYSTPSIYLQAKNKEGLTWTTKQDDLFPYADNPNGYWTGYFTSRPAFKRYVRSSSAFLLRARQVELLNHYNGNWTDALWAAMSVVQHHDAVSGTAKQGVTYDYAYLVANGTLDADAVLELGLAKLVTKAGGSLPAFSYCPLANTSICPATSTSSSLVVVIYNPIARARTQLVRIPTGFTAVSVIDGQQQTVPSQVVALPQQNPSYTGDSLPNEVRFIASVQGIGLSTYFITSSSTDTSKSTSRPTSSSSGKAPSRHRHARKPLSYVSPSPSPAGPATSTAPVSISNQYWTLDFDTNGILYQITDLSTETVTPFKQQFYYYRGFQGTGQHSGAYIFRPDPANDTGTLISSTAAITTVVGPVSTEIQQTFTPWLTQVIRLDNVTRAINFEYTVGPIPIGDSIGKEIIVRYTTNIASQSTWYTDSNGREFQKRMRNTRPTWQWNATQPVAGNYFPVNAAIWLTDGNQGMAILNDRSQGGTSLTDGELELMVHRRLLVDDSKGVGEALNETGLDGRGLIITGTHTLILQSPLADFSTTVRTMQHQIYAPFHISYAALTGSVVRYLTTHNAVYSASSTPLPDNVELMSLYAQADQSVLLRLQHNYGVGEASPQVVNVTVNLLTLFTSDSIALSNCTEKSLTNNQLPSDIKRLSWNIKSTTSNSGVGKEERRADTTDEKIERQRRVQADGTVTLAPAEIRTFVCNRS